MIFSPLLVPKIKLNRSPGASLKSSSGTSGIESNLKSAPLGILNKILLLIFPQEFVRKISDTSKEENNKVDLYKFNF